MGYFNKLPMITYDFSDDYIEREIHTLSDISIRVNPVFDQFAETSILRSYYIKEGETPQSIAREVYGDDKLDWLVLYANDITDIVNEWPLTESQMVSFLSSKYSGTSPSYSNVITLKGYVEKRQVSVSPVAFKSYFVPYDYDSVDKTAEYLANKEFLAVGDCLTLGGAYSSSLGFAENIRIAAILENEVELSEPLIMEYNSSLNSKPFSFHLQVPNYDTSKWFLADESGVIAGYNHIIDVLHENPVEVTHRIYEIDRNEKKRNILIINPEYVNQFLLKFNGAIV